MKLPGVKTEWNYQEQKLNDIRKTKFKYLNGFPMLFKYLNGFPMFETERWTQQAFVSIPNEHFHEISQAGVSPNGKL